jgi:hypothetical protein
VLDLIGAGRFDLSGLANFSVDLQNAVNGQPIEVDFTGRGETKRRIRFLSEDPRALREIPPAL